LLTLFAGAFLLASQPRVAGFLDRRLPISESKLLKVGDVLNVGIAVRGLKSSDQRSEIYFFAGKFWEYSYGHELLIGAGDRNTTQYDAPITGSFLIRSPPYDTVT